MNAVIRKVLLFLLRDLVDMQYKIHIVGALLFPIVSVILLQVDIYIIKGLGLYS